MRVIAGRLRSRILKAPAGLSTRPTSDRLRETLFNVLAPRIEGIRFADLYAGSGAVGIEAISRGAAEVIFVEKAHQALRALRGNLESLSITGGYRIQAESVQAFIASAADHSRRPSIDLVFLDPPYDEEAEYESTLALLGGRAGALLAPDALVIAEHRRKTVLFEEYGVLHRVRLLTQGDASLSFFAIRKENSRETHDSDS